MTVESMLRGKENKVVTVRPDQALIEAADLLHKHRIGAVLVCDGAKCVGVLSERDIVAGLSNNRTAALSQSVKLFMSSPVISCSTKDKTKDIMEVMSSKRIRHLPVIRDEQVIGMISIGDVIKHRLESQKMEVAVLRDYAIAVR